MKISNIATNLGKSVADFGNHLQLLCIYCSHTTSTKQDFNSNNAPHEHCIFPLILIYLTFLWPKSLLSPV